ncbi:lipoate--protein ligase family protein [Cohnella luojiensis]|uniref:Lipoate--protein ligase family protein n=1 Tax=Cohnella luojiensis TaxID=652876 RepID=A0A4Y8M0C2_9BACL|nr:biotin/lipoate A/B protein ligase family protein [Cohnella luojiensis]TFE25180.1 lipoate--protein ligase family protein [Cohnella luojiensis]
MWRFIHTGNRSPAENMAIDEAMLTAHQEGMTPPTVRFYGWSPATLSIGYFQQASKEVDFEALRSRGIGFVRRATGGRAVLHDRELTYSIIVSESYPGIPANITEAYRVLSLGLLQGFRNLGLDARMTGVDAAKDDAEETGASRPAGSSACFDSPSRYELVVEGRKIAGSAQMRAKGVILQHGSIPLDLDAGLLFDVLRFSDDRAKIRMKRVFENKAVAVNACMRSKNKSPVTLPELESAFRAGFAEGLGAELVSDKLSDMEEERARRLSIDKYASDGWNFRR